MQRRTVALIFLGSTAAAGATLPSIGCDNTPDATTNDASSDHVGTDAGLECAGELPLMKWKDENGNLKDPDWSCYGADAGFLLVQPNLLDDAEAGDAPMDDAADAGADSAPDVDAGADSGVDAGAMATFHLEDFVSLSGVGNAQVSIYNGNTLSQPPDFTATTSAGGDFAFPVPPNGVMAYKVAARTTAPALHAVVQFDNISPKAGQQLVGNTITEQSVTLLGSGVLGQRSFLPNTIIITTGVRDCASHELQGGVVELVDDTTGNVLLPGNGATDFASAYFNSDRLPDSRCTHTVTAPFTPQNVPLALWTAANIPAGRSLTIRLSGRMTAADSTPRVVGTRKVENIPDVAQVLRAYRLSKP